LRLLPSLWRQTSVFLANSCIYDFFLFPSLLLSIILPQSICSNVKLLSVRCVLSFMPSTTKAKQPKGFSRPSAAAFCEAAERLNSINAMVSKRRMPAIIYLSSGSEKDETNLSGETISLTPAQWRPATRFHETNSVLETRQAQSPRNLGKYLRLSNARAQPSQSHSAAEPSSFAQQAQTGTKREPITPRSNLMWDESSPTPGPSRP
jgi:hypothetical protein